jgi:hypothetical protein
MVNRIVVLEKGVEKKVIAAGVCCSVVPAGKLAR